MPNRPRRIPSYRHYKPENLAVVRINGIDEYLGKFNSAESWEKYHRRIAEWLSNGQVKTEPAAGADQSDCSLAINELILSYWKFAKSHYSKEGEPTKELTCMQEAIRPLRQLYGHTRAAEFGPKALKAVRQHMVAQGLSRGVVNHRIDRIKRVFKWATAEELIPSSILHGLQAITGLRYGQTTARETAPIRPIADLYVAAILPFVTPHVAAMIKLQRLTGMRAGELVVMRPCDIDTSEEIWTYEPFDHKNRWRGCRKQIPLGPEAQQILKPFLNRDPKQSCSARLLHRG